MTSPGRLLSCSDAMDCPVCMEPLTSAKSFVLDCGHRMCIGCSVEWIKRNAVCPLCRANVTTMSRATRSKSRIQYVLDHVKDGLLRASTTPCECLSHGIFCPAKEIREVLDRLVLKEKHVWRRTDMQKYLRELKTFSVGVKARIINARSEHVYRLIQVLNKISEV